MTIIDFIDNLIKVATLYDNPGTRKIEIEIDGSMHPLPDSMQLKARQAGRNWTFFYTS